MPCGRPGPSHTEGNADSANQSTNLTMEGRGACPHHGLLGGPWTPSQNQHSYQMRGEGGWAGKPRLQAVQPPPQVGWGARSGTLAPGLGAGPRIFQLCIPPVSRTRTDEPHPLRPEFK